MGCYNYIDGLNRLKEILDNDLTSFSKNKLPLNDDEFTFTNGIYSFISAIFVDIRDSTLLCKNPNKKVTAKILRSFISETLEILRESDNLREIGIRGDCVYSIYTTPTKEDVYEVADKCIWVNTFIKMLNKLFRKKGFNPIKIGIGMATDKELVVKAGRKNVGINSKIWIGKAVTHACHYANIGNKNGIRPMIFSSRSYNLLIDNLGKRNYKHDVKEWFRSMVGPEGEKVYTANLIKAQFSKWIDDL